MTTPPPSFLSVCRFLRGHAPGLRTWATKGFARWVRWYWCDARVGVVTAHGQVVAVALARCLKDAAEGAQPCVHHEDGSLVWIDDIASTHAEGVAVLLSHADQRFGPRQAYCGRVFSRSGELRMIPMTTVERLILGAKTNGLTLNSGSTRRT